MKERRALQVNAPRLGIAARGQSGWELLLLMLLLRCLLCVCRSGNVAKLCVGLASQTTQSTA